MIVLFIVIILTIILFIYKFKKEQFSNNSYKINIDNIFNNIMTNNNFKKYTPVLVNNDPWIITLDSFLTPEECKELINVPSNWNISNLTGGKNNKEYRNSYSYNCNNECLDINIVNKIQNRIEEIVSIPKTNYEDMTLTKYYKGGFFKIHHDYVPKEANLKTFNKIGPRILTCLIYLTDDITDDLDGGSTSFNKLKYNIKPKLGRALIWTNVDNNLEKDERTSHEALPVIDGTKIISQTWIHSKNYH